MSNYRLPTLRYPNPNSPGQVQMDRRTHASNVPNVTPNAGHDWSAFDKAFGTGAPSNGAYVTNPPARTDGIRPTGGKPLDVNSPAIQAALDRAAHVTPTVVRPGVNVPSQYGSGHVDLPAETAATNAAFNEKNGIPDLGVEPYDQATSRQRLYSAYPEVFKAGTPENQAFTKYAQQYGEQAAHENASSFLDPIVQQKAGTIGTPAVAGRHDLAAPGSTDAIVSQRATDKIRSDQAQAGPFTPESLPGRALIAAQNAPSAGSVVKSGIAAAGQAVGLRPDVANNVANNVTNAGSNYLAELVNPIRAAKDAYSSVQSWFGDKNANTANAPTPSAAPAPGPTAPTGQPPAKPAALDNATNNIPATSPTTTNAPTSTSASAAPAGDDDDEARRKALAAQQPSAGLGF
jgi:hypothetical protein